MKRKVYCIFLIGLCLLMAALPALAQEGGFPLAQEPVTLTIMTEHAAEQGPYADMITFTTYEQMTNVHINWIEVASSVLAEKVQLSLAGGELPDMYYKCNLSQADLLYYGSEGSIIPLNDLIEQHAPHIKAILDAKPGIKASLTMTDGNIYSLPYIVECVSPNLPNKLFLNMDWLEKAGAKVPETTDELFDTLMTMRAYDYNGDGKLEENIITAGNFNNIIAALSGSFGIANRSYAFGNWDEDPQAPGQLRFWPITQRYKELLEYLNKLYTNNLIDQEIFTQTPAAYAGKATQGPALNMFINNSNAGEFAAYYQGLAPLKGPHGDQLWTSVLDECRNPGAFAITSACKDPVMAIKWVDYFYSKEGSLLYFMGVEGETCQWDEALGKYVYVDAIRNNTEGLTFDQAVARHVPWTSNGGPAVATYEVFSGAAVNAISQAAAETLSPYAVEMWPALKYTKDENDIVSDIANQINTYITQMTAEFVIGRTSFDQWDTYVDTIYQMGLEEWGQYAQEALNRMQGGR